jgi:hypothetical protein
MGWFNILRAAGKDTRVPSKIQAVALWGTESASLELGRRFQICNLEICSAAE